MTMAELGLDRLSADERRTLADELYESVDGDEVSPEVMTELARRIAELDANPTSAIPWESLAAELEASARK